MSTAVHQSVSSVSLAEREAARGFDPQHYLLGLLREAIAAGQPMVIARADGGEIRVVPQQVEYFTDIPRKNLEGFCSELAGRYTVRPMTDGELAALASGKKIGRNLDELMWVASLAVSNGRLIKGCRRDDVVLLKHWPNLTRVAGTPNAVRISALLTRYPTSVVLGYRLLKITEAELNDFYSAAHCAGLAVAVNRKPELSEETELKPHRQRGLLSSILNRIMGM